MLVDPGAQDKAMTLQLCRSRRITRLHFERAGAGPSGSYLMTNSNFRRPTPGCNAIDQQNEGMKGCHEEGISSNSPFLLSSCLSPSVYIAIMSFYSSSRTILTTQCRRAAPPAAKACPATPNIHCKATKGMFLCFPEVLR
jgi:hypothetical protein